MADASPGDRSIAATGAGRGLRHHAHQRPQDLRHHPEHGRALITGRSENPRRRHLQQLLDRGWPGTRSGNCRGAVHPCHPRHAVQPQEDPRMSVQTASLPAAAQTPRQRLRVRPSRIVLNVVLAAVAIFWLVPSIGIAIISLRPNSAFQQSGWWTVFTAPAQLTFSNYQQLFSAGCKAGGVLDSLTTSIAITVPVTILVTVISSLTAYSLVFGRWRGRTAVFLLIVAMLVLPLQMALIPVASLYKIVYNATGLHLCGSVIGTIIFHVAFGLP